MGLMNVSCPTGYPSSSAFQRTLLFIWALGENKCAGFTEGCGTDREDEAGISASTLAAKASLSPESSRQLRHYRSTSRPPCVSSTVDYTLIGGMQLLWCGFSLKGLTSRGLGPRQRSSWAKWVFLSGGSSACLPPWLALKCACFPELFSGTVVCFYENDLFLCGLWLSGCSCSVADEEWGQANAFPHGCLFLYA